MTMIDKMILSDIHAGLATSRWQVLEEEINKCNPQNIIMIGDVVDSAPMEPVEPWIDILTRICTKWKWRVWWVLGNHDWLLGPPLAEKVGAHCLEHYRWDDINGSNVAIHGHQFDDMIIDHPEISAVATKLYSELQELPYGATVAEYLKYASKIISRDAEKIQKGAVAFAQREDKQNIFCGHVHSYRYRNVDGINYYNDGCCCSTDGTYFTIDEKGLIELQKF